jgi:hypothetical protein
MFFTVALVLLLLYSPLAVHSLGWFGVTKKQHNPHSHTHSHTHTLDKLSKVLSTYSHTLSHTHSHTHSQSTDEEIQQNLKKQADEWRVREEDERVSKGVAQERSRSSGIRKYSSRRPMDGATFDMTTSGE